MPRAMKTPEGILIQCPGCKSDHVFQTAEINSVYSTARWTFNGNLDKPTFSPSMNYQCNPKSHKDYQPQAPSSVCHSFVRDGRIEFLSDCTHDKAGQTLELEEIPEHRLERAAKRFLEVKASTK